MVSKKRIKRSYLVYIKVFPYRSLDEFDPQAAGQTVNLETETENKLKEVLSSDIRKEHKERWKEQEIFYIKKYMQYSVMIKKVKSTLNISAIGRLPWETLLRSM